MRKLLFSVSIAILFLGHAFAQSPGIEGTYSLVSSTRKIVETGEVVDTYGKHPSGYIVYGHDSHFVALIVWDKNDRPNPISVGNISDQQRAELFRTMLAYGGTYNFNGQTVEHHIDTSWNQVWTGTTVLRDVHQEAGNLVYVTRPALFSSDGKISIVTLVWKKIE